VERVRRPQCSHETSSRVSRSRNLRRAASTLATPRTYVMAGEKEGRKESGGGEGGGGGNSPVTAAVCTRKQGGNKVLADLHQYTGRAFRPSCHGHSPHVTVRRVTSSWTSIYR